MALFTELFKEYSFVYLEFKMRQYPDIRVERQETGRKKKSKKPKEKQQQQDITGNISRSKLGKEFFYQLLF